MTDGPVGERLFNDKDTAKLNKVKVDILKQFLNTSRFKRANLPVTFLSSAETVHSFPDLPAAHLPRGFGRRAGAGTFTGREKGGAARGPVSECSVLRRDGLREEHAAHAVGSWRRLARPRPPGDLRLSSRGGVFTDEFIPLIATGLSRDSGWSGGPGCAP